MKILSAKDYSRRLKATIQRNGRLGFTSETAEELELETMKSVKFAQDDEDGILYMSVMSEDKDEDAFRICSAGEYFYIATRNMFDALGYDYAKKKIMFDMTRRLELDKELGGKTYMLKRRYGKDKG